MVRGKPERFAEHYAQARLFYRSQTKVEQDHIVRAFRFELSRVQTAAVRERMLALLLNVDRTLAERVAEGLGMELPAPLPLPGEDPTALSPDGVIDAGEPVLYRLDLTLQWGDGTPKQTFRTSTLRALYPLPEDL